MRLTGSFPESLSPQHDGPLHSTAPLAQLHFRTPHPASKLHAAPSVHWSTSSPSVRSDWHVNVELVPHGPVVDVHQAPGKRHGPPR
jgi:hypothetical protein